MYPCQDIIESCDYTCMDIIIMISENPQSLSPSNLCILQKDVELLILENLLMLSITELCSGISSLTASSMLNQEYVP